MVKMNWLFVITFIVTIAEITPYIEEQVTSYYQNDIVQRATDQWQKHVISYQNTLSIAMHESFGFKGMNVYLNKRQDPLFVSKGYYHFDNQVHLVLQDLRLDDYPQISDSVISYPLTSNVIKLEADVSRMIVHASYILFRNRSNIVYELNDQNSFKISPFLFEQVNNIGEIAITIEGCKLSGIGITSLSGSSISLGNSVFRLRRCQYNIEIFTPGIPSPPVVASYYLQGEGLNIDHLLMIPLEGEMVTKLQAALHSYINTSAIFQDILPPFRLQQDQVFEQTTNYVNNVVRNLNVLTITRNAGKIIMEDFIIYYNDTFGQGEQNSAMTLSGMILTGLETVYSSHKGGPFKLTTVKISEELRFSTLQVKGSIDVQVGDKTLGMYDFAIEINDVEVDVTANLQNPEDKSPFRSMHVIEVMGWRTFEFSSPGMLYTTGEALITGYLLTKVPIYLANYLNSVVAEAVRETDNDYKMLEGDGQEKLKIEKLPDVPGDNGQDYGGQGDGGQDYGGQGNAGQDYGGQNYGGQGDAGQDYGGQNNGGQDYGGQGNAGQDYGGQDYGGQNYGGQNYGGQGDGGKDYGGQDNAGQDYNGPTGGIEGGNIGDETNLIVDNSVFGQSPSQGTDGHDDGEGSLVEGIDDGLVSPSAIIEDDVGFGVTKAPGEVAPGGSLTNTDEEHPVPSDIADQLPLQANFFDESMFENAQMQNG